METDTYLCELSAKYYTQLLQRGQITVSKKLEKFFNKDGLYFRLQGQLHTGPGGRKSGLIQFGVEKPRRD